MAQVDAYAVNVGNTTWGIATTEAKEAALRRAARYISAFYGHLFPGVRTYGLEQTLPWPRKGVMSDDGYAFPSDYIPSQLITAQIEVALREQVSPGGFLSDKQLRGKKSVTVGPISVTYDDVSALDNRPYPLIHWLMLPLLDTSKTAGTQWLLRA